MIKEHETVAKIKVTWCKSQICCQEQHRRTLKALGFRKLNQTRVYEDNPAIRGMLNHVNFLVKVEEVAE